jgi:two-component system chemotaxis response regulator CheB
MSAIVKESVFSNAAPPTGEDGIRVMMVDDSVVVRGLVSRWINEEPGLIAVGKFSNGLKALENVVEVDPDVIVLDIEMPVMSGIEALPQILKRLPGVQVIMASTLTQRNAEISLNALSLGAADYVPKPVSNSGVTTSAEFRNDLIEKIKALGAKRAKRTSARRQSSIGTSSQARASNSAPRPVLTETTTVSQPEVTNSPGLSLRAASKMRPRVLVIGSSTGGPPALVSVMEKLAPKLGNIPVLITQHMPATFTGIFASHIARASGLVAKEGIDGETIIPGRVYVAPGGRHMIVERKGASAVIRLTDGPEVNFCKPAVDPLFETASKVFGASTLAVVFTGMGTDGAKGADIVANAGGSVLAQDEETSVVWGMPGATAKIGACCAILPLNKIADKLANLIQGIKNDTE